MLRFILLFLLLSFSGHLFANDCKSSFSINKLPKNNPFSRVDEFPETGIPFSKIQKEHILPAAEFFAKEIRDDLTRIKQQPASFKNTIEPLSFLNQKLDSVGLAFGVLKTVDSRFFQLDGKLNSLYVEQYTSIISDKEIFQKVREVYKNKIKKKYLSEEQKKLLKDTYDFFKKNGLNFNEKEFQTFKQILQEMNIVLSQIEKNILREENEYERYLDQDTDLTGISEEVKMDMKNKAKIKGHPDKWLVNYEGNTISEIFNFAENRSLRKQIYLDIHAPNFKGKYDNSDLILKLFKLRNQEAQLFDYKNYVEWVATENMVKNTKNLENLLDEIKKNYKKEAAGELDRITEFMSSILNVTHRMEPWDLDFYIEKYRETVLDVSIEEFKPYFELNQVMEGLFIVADKLFDLKFRQTEKYSKFHKDVTVYEVYNKIDNKFIGLVYMDLFERKTKHLGAWTLPIVYQGLSKNGMGKPQVLMATNIPRKKDEANLLYHSDVETLFHEFGHTLHSLLSNVKYKEFSGVSGRPDFVEFPSQLMEEWAYHKDSLSLFAKHYETGEIIPEDLIDKLNKERRFNRALRQIGNLKFIAIDLAWHSQDLKNVKDIKTFERKVFKDFRLLRHKPSCQSVVSCNFSHILSGGYAGQYYSYLWSEFLANHTFELFEKKGVFHKPTAEAYRRLLEKGSSVDPMKLYLKFRKEEPQIKSL